jgi:ATP-dependent Clp protease ATP-binding subunit ClpC
VHSNKDVDRIEVEGYNLKKILGGETGIHLFYVAQNLPVPIKVLMTQNGNPVDNPSFKVIRVFDGNDTMTDLRTGYTNAMNLTEDELKLLLYGGLKAG